MYGLESMNWMEHEMMEPRYRENGRARPADGPLPTDDVDLAQPAPTDTVAHEFTSLMADVQELLGGIAHLADPEIGRARAKIEAGIASTRQALADGALRARRQAADAVRGGDRYVRDRPWQAVGIAAALGLIVGALATSRWTRRPRRA